MPLKADLKKLMLLTNQRSNKKLIGYEKEIIRQYKKALTSMKAELAKYYENNYSTARISGVISKIESILKDAGENGLNTTKNAISDTVDFNFNSVQANLQKTIGSELSFAVLNPTVANSLVINNKFAKINWASKGISNIQNANNILRTEITQGLLQGKNYGVVAKNITNQVNISTSNALRIVKTEVHRASNEARILSMQESKGAAEKLGFTSVKIWDGGTSFPRNHDSMNGETIPVDAEFVLPSGNSTMAPGETGDPTDDVNCGCYITFDLLELQNI